VLPFACSLKRSRYWVQWNDL